MSWKRHQKDKERFMKRFFSQYRPQISSKTDLGRLINSEGLLWPADHKVNSSALPSVFGALSQN